MTIVVLEQLEHDLDIDLSTEGHFLFLLIWYFFITCLLVVTNLLLIVFNHGKVHDNILVAIAHEHTLGIGEKFES